MSRWGKISLMLSGLSVAILVATRYLLGGWVNFLFIFLAIFVIGLIVAIIVDIKFFIDFLSMRTTKHGMNMGAMILMMIVLLVSVNFLGVHFNKTFDFTIEQINSLAGQTQELLKNLKDDVQIKIFYVESEQSAQTRGEIRQTLSLFQENSPKIKMRLINSYEENVEAQSYLNDLPDKDREQVFVFAEFHSRRVRVEPPYSEEKFTEALVKVTRESQKKIYFLRSHGERDIEATDPEGIKTFKQSLEDASFIVNTWSPVESPKVPEDATILAIIGPTAPFLDAELEMIREFGRKGGKVLLGIDPGQKHNMAQLTKTFGVEFQNNFIIEELNRLLGRGAASALGLIYDKASEVTSRLREGEMTVFDLASELKPAADPGSLKIVELVKSNPNSFAINELSQNAPHGERHSMDIAIGVSGHLDKAPGADPKSPDTSPDFAAVIVGDSDFVSNKSLFQGLNRDLALNSVAYLAKESDLITIRPRQMLGTHMTMTNTIQVVVVMAGLLLPLMFLVTSGVLWFRRRSA